MIAGVRKKRDEARELPAEADTPGAMLPVDLVGSQTERTSRSPRATTSIASSRIPV